MKNLIDEIGKANLTDTFNSSVGSLDRFCNRSAININCGSAKIPTGVYFSGDFTLSFWLQLLHNHVLGTHVRFTNLSQFMPLHWLKHEYR